MRTLWAVVLVAVAAAGSLRAGEITVDFGQRLGVIRPLHGINLGPSCYRGMVDLSPYHRELRVPLTRLHDVVWLQADAVDVSTVFRDFRNSPDQPESYDFAVTDDYVQSVIDVGSEVVYRLGESIEHTPRQYRVHPPPDPEKWARICLGIVRHYHDGWAQGFRHRIRYWEIWNEPDVRPAMWTGTDGQFFRLFAVTAKTIKARFPELKVGGPALGGTGEFEGDEFRPTAFCRSFLAYCRTNNVPLDFLSWHRYTSDPWDLPRRARAMRRLLDESGFEGTESHLNEWNYLPRDDWRPMLREGQGEMREAWYEEMGGPAAAAFAACGLLLLQDAPVDAANFYTGEIQAFGLFNFHGVPKKTFYAFKAFRDLLDTPRRVQVSGLADHRMAAVAGLAETENEARVLLASVEGWPGPLQVNLHRLPWTSSTLADVFAVDADHNFAPVDRQVTLRGPVTLDRKGPAVVLLRLRPTTGPPNQEPGP